MERSFLLASCIVCLRKKCLICFSHFEKLGQLGKIMQRDIGPFGKIQFQFNHVYVDVFSNHGFEANYIYMGWVLRGLSGLKSDNIWLGWVGLDPLDYNKRQFFFEENNRAHFLSAFLFPLKLLGILKVFFITFWWNARYSLAWLVGIN